VTHGSPANIAVTTLACHNKNSPRVPASVAPGVPLSSPSGRDGATRSTGPQAEGLAARGVDVTLFATLDSVTSAELDGLCPRGYADDPSLDGRVREASVRTVGRVRSGAQPPGLAAAGLRRALPDPVAHDGARFSGMDILPAYRRSASEFVSISDADRNAELNYTATVYPRSGPRQPAVRPAAAAGAVDSSRRPGPR